MTDRWSTAPSPSGDPPLRWVRDQLCCRIGHAARIEIPTLRAGMTVLVGQE